MTETQPYEVVRSEAGFELRRYPAHVVAETTVKAGFEDAGNRAFRYLFAYISGANTAQKSIEMTAPVVQAASQKISMTSPVVQTASGDDFTVAFVLPATFDEASAPAPTSSEVSLRTVPSRLAAALRFSGRWTVSAYEKHLSQLLTGVADAGLTAVGEPWFARFNAPYTPWFLRRNEVVVEIDEAAGL